MNMIYCDFDDLENQIDYYYGVTKELEHTNFNCKNLNKIKEKIKELEDFVDVMKEHYDIFEKEQSILNFEIEIFEYSIEEFKLKLKKKQKSNCKILYKKI